MELLLQKKEVFTIPIETGTAQAANHEEPEPAAAVQDPEAQAEAAPEDADGTWVEVPDEGL